MKLEDIASVIRSKNAGPRALTLDVMFADDAVYARAAQSPALPCRRRLLAAIYGEGGDCSASNPDTRLVHRHSHRAPPLCRRCFADWTLRRGRRNGCDARGAVHSRGEAGDAASTFARCKHCSSRWRRAAGSPSTAGCWSLARASWASRGYCHVNDITMSIQLFSCILRRAQVQHRYAGPTDRSPLHGIAWRKAPGNRCYRIVRLRVSPLKAIQREAMHVPTAPRVISNGITRAKLTSALHTDGVSGR